MHLDTSHHLLVHLQPVYFFHHEDLFWTTRFQYSRVHFQKIRTQSKAPGRNTQPDIFYRITEEIEKQHENALQALSQSIRAGLWVPNQLWACILNALLKSCIHISDCIFTEGTLQPTATEMGRIFLAVPSPISEMAFIVNAWGRGGTMTSSFCTLKHFS